MHIVIATTQVPFVHGGAEVHADNLCAALIEAGHRAEIVRIPYKWYPPESILDAMAACRLLDVSEANGRRIDLMIGLKFPAYLMPHPNKVLWILHQHRTAYEQWDHELGDMIVYPNGQEIRTAIYAADRKAIPEAKRVYTNSNNVSSRLQRFLGIRSTPLYHPPLNAEKFYCAAAEDFVLFPSRINRSKRQLLAIQALGRADESARLVICGESEDAQYFAEMESQIEALGLASRVIFTGRVSEEEKLSLYARALAVMYLPYDEDYGYVTLEAMLSRKAVITCKDSGGPLEFVAPETTGLVAEPEAGAVAEALDYILSDRRRAATMGQMGYEKYRAMNISWEAVVQELTA